MRFVNSILKIDYSLSAWFPKTKQTIIPGAAFLFLNKLAFLITAVYFVVLTLLPFRFGIGLAIAILCGLMLLTMYGLQSKVQTAIEILDYSREYSKLSDKEKVSHRIYGLVMFLGCFVLMFFVGITFFTGYAN